MRYTILICIAFLCKQYGDVFGQTPLCMPDSSYLDSVGGVYPVPFDPMVAPDGGINEVACIGQPFEFVFTAHVTPDINFGGFLVPLNYVEIEPMGAIDDLPDGLEYACDPPNCRITPNDTLGCFIIFGTPTGPAGTHDLVFNATISTSLGTGPQTFPGLLAPGNYFLEVKENSDPDCTTVSVQEVSNDKAIKLFAHPNPGSHIERVVIHSNVKSDGALTIYDMSKRAIWTEEVRVQAGLNVFEVDCTKDLANGTYAITFDGQAHQSAILFVKM